MAKQISWRDRLALLCLRALAPEGILGNNVPLGIGYGPGKSSPDDPKLVIYFVYERPDGKRQTILAPVFGPPESAVDIMTEAVDYVRDWAVSRG